MDNAKVNIAMFIDLKKAFDTVDHNILWKKMKFYGIFEKELSNNSVSSHIQTPRSVLQKRGAAEFF